MAYFPNGTSGYDYEANLCGRCQHYAEGMCPILCLHSAWNYDAVGDNADEEKHWALDMFIPMSADGLSPVQCVMFVEDKGKPDPNQTDLDL